MASNRKTRERKEKSISKRPITMGYDKKNNAVVFTDRRTGKSVACPFEKA